MAIPEWKLDETADEAVSYQFANINTKMVFLLALGVAVLVVGFVYFAYVCVNLAIDANLIPQPPSLQGIVD